MTTFDFDALQDLLRCPQTRAELVYTEQGLVSCDPDTRLRYPIVDGFPIMLVEEAIALSPADWAVAMRQAGRDETTGQVSV